jgi:hypothetical protein
MIIVIWSELTTIYCSHGSFYKQVFKQKIRSDNVFREKNAVVVPHSDLNNCWSEHFVIVVVPHSDLNNCWSEHFVIVVSDNVFREKNANQDI